MLCVVWVSFWDVFRDPGQLKWEDVSREIKADHKFSVTTIQVAGFSRERNKGGVGMMWLRTDRNCLRDWVVSQETHKVFWYIVAIKANLLFLSLFYPRYLESLLQKSSPHLNLQWWVSSHFYALLFDITYFYPLSDFSVSDFCFCFFFLMYNTSMKHNAKKMWRSLFRYQSNLKLYY